MLISLICENVSHVLTVFSSHETRLINLGAFEIVTNLAI